MAIYAGNWKDGDGVPFDPNAFAHVDYGASGSARSRRLRPRSSPGRAQATYNFRRLAETWSMLLSDPERTEWAVAAGALDRETRSGTFPTLTAHAFFQRCCHPALTINGTYLASPPTFPPPVSTDIYAQEYVEATQIFSALYFVYAADQGDPDTGIAMFQIHPAHAGQANEIAFTNLIGYTYPLPRVLGPHYIYGNAAWPVPDHQPARAMVRRWQLHNFDRVIDTYNKT